MKVAHTWSSSCRLVLQNASLNPQTLKLGTTGLSDLEDGTFVDPRLGNPPALS